MTNTKRVVKALSAIGLAGCAVMGSSAAMAVEEGWLIGINAGQSMARIDVDSIRTQLLGSGLATTTLTERDRKTAFKLFGGYKFSDYARLGAPLSLLYLFYRRPLSIVILTLLFSLTGVVFRLAWMDLAAKSCPEGAEATVFAAYMAVFNIAASASNTLGGRLYESLSAAHGAYAAMVILSLVGTAGTLAAWPCLRFALKGGTRTGASFIDGSGHDAARA